jgi:hypothetical protein
MYSPPGNAGQRRGNKSASITHHELNGSTLMLTALMGMTTIVFAADSGVALLTNRNRMTQAQTGS